MEQMLSALGNRVFLMNNVHDDGPTLFQTRWALSFLAGPLARAQISTLMAPRKAAAVSHAESTVAAVATPSRPVVPTGVNERFLKPTAQPPADSKLVYRPAIFGAGSLHYVRAAADVDQWIDYRCLLPCGRGLPEELWQAATELSREPDLDDDPNSSFAFVDLPNELRSAATFKKLATQFKDHLYRHHSLAIYRAPALDKFAPPGLTEGEARIHFTQDVRELRDRETEKVRAKFAGKAQTLEKAIRAAGERFDRERDALNQTSVASAVTMATSILGTFFSNKAKSRSTTPKAEKLIRGATEAVKKKADADRAKDAMRQLQLDLEDLEIAVKAEIDHLTRRFDVHRIDLDTVAIAPRKSDLKAEPLTLLWTPWQIDDHGMAEPLYEGG
jgi:hypothetical protein